MNRHEDCAPSSYYLFGLLVRRNTGVGNADDGNADDGNEDHDAHNARRIRFVAKNKNGMQSHLDHHIHVVAATVLVKMPVVEQRHPEHPKVLLLQL